MKIIKAEVEKMVNQNVITLYGEERENQINIDCKISEIITLKFDIYYNERQKHYEVDFYISELRNLAGKELRGIVSEKYCQYKTERQVLKNIKETISHYMDLEIMKLKIDMEVMKVRKEALK